MVGVRAVHKRLSKIAVAMALVVAASITLSGCAAQVGGVVEKALAASASKAKVDKLKQLDKGKPKSGECWRSSFANADGYAVWDKTDPVGCDKTHQLLTFGVPELKLAHKGKLFDGEGNAHEAIEEDAYDTCGDTERATFSGLDETSARLVIEPFLPYESQWNKGARWVRCDIGVLALGASVDKPEFADLPTATSLDKQIENHQVQFDYCVNVPAAQKAAGPHAKGAVYADCRDNPQWVLHSYEQLYSGPSDKYPTAASLRSQYVESCQSKYADATHMTFPSYPSASDWAGGNEDLECWVGRK